MMPREEFYQQHLERVSRSFAFCIRQLPTPLRGWVGLSYLVCRILDTVEDAAWSNSQQQLDIFQKFDRAIAGSATELRQWQRDFPRSISGGEQLLLEDAAQIIEDVQALNEPIRQVVRDMVACMSRGMQHFVRMKQQGVFRLGSLREVNQYCFFVAGLVGEALAKMVAYVDPKFQLSRARILEAHHFGLFLQKVNLLKDQAVDQKSGRLLVPSRELLLRSLKLNARQALNFLQALPLEQIEFRRFCGWSLFLGLETLHGQAQKPDFKLLRPQTETLLNEISGQIQNNQELERLFEQRHADLGWHAVEMSPHVEPSLEREASIAPHWILSAYHGWIDNSGMVDLGLA